jgi:predicted DNA-binding transcriptional regulator YafY
VQWNLALDRINGDIEKTKNKYKGDLTNWEEFFDDMIGVSKGKGQQPEEVKLIFNKEQAPYIKTKPLHSTQKDKILENGFLEIRINVVLNYELEMKILSYGEKVKVIAPETLVNKIKKSIELLFKNY